LFVCLSIYENAETLSHRLEKSHKSPDVGAKGATKETTTPPRQEAAGTQTPPRDPPSEGGRLLSHREELSKPDLPGQAPKRADSQPNTPEDCQKQPLIWERNARKGAGKTPYETSISHTSPAPTNEGSLVNPLTHEPHGPISDTRSAITGFIEFTPAVISEGIIRREQEILEIYHPRST